MDKKRKVAIIGGGWAGCAAATTLATLGLSVTLYETAKTLGGRARGFSHKGLQLDNGQHILLGAYRETLKLMVQVGVDVNRQLLRLPLNLEIPGHFRLSPSSLPAPFHVIASLMTAHGLSFSDRWATLLWMIRQKLRNFKLRQDMTVAELLTGQPERMVRLMWEPLCLAALNTSLQEASAQIFLNVLRDSFDSKKNASDLLLPNVDLSELFPLMASNFISRQGGSVRTFSTVSSIKATTDQVEVNGEYYDHVIVAVAPFSVAKLVAHQPELQGTLTQIKSLRYQPITTVYLQYDVHTTLHYPMLGMNGGLGQWVFDRGQLCGQSGLFSIVISTEGNHLTLPHDKLAEKIHEELIQFLPTLTKPLWHQVITEKRATFACLTNLVRPQNATSHPRIWLAGDYTAGDYPATIEGAVRSGIKCADLVIKSQP